MTRTRPRMSIKRRYKSIKVSETNSSRRAIYAYCTRRWNMVRGPGFNRHPAGSRAVKKCRTIAIKRARVNGYLHRGDTADDQPHTHRTTRHELSGDTPPTLLSRGIGRDPRPTNHYNRPTFYKHHIAYDKNPARPSCTI